MVPPWRALHSWNIRVEKDPDNVTVLPDCAAKLRDQLLNFDNAVPKDEVIIRQTVSVTTVENILLELYPNESAYCDSGHKAYAARWMAAKELQDRARGFSRDQRDSEETWQYFMTGTVFNEINQRLSSSTKKTFTNAREIRGNFGEDMNKPAPDVCVGLSLYHKKDLTSLKGTERHEAGIVYFEESEISRLQTAGGGNLVCQPIVSQKSFAFPWLVAEFKKELGDTDEVLRQAANGSHTCFKLLERLADRAKKEAQPFVAMTTVGPEMKLFIMHKRGREYTDHWYCSDSGGHSSPYSDNGLESLSSDNSNNRTSPDASEVPDPVPAGFGPGRQSPERTDPETPTRQRQRSGFSNDRRSQDAPSLFGSASRFRTSRIDDERISPTNVGGFGADVRRKEKEELSRNRPTSAGASDTQPSTNTRLFGSPPSASTKVVEKQPSPNDSNSDRQGSPPTGMFGFGGPSFGFGHSPRGFGSSAFGTGFGLSSNPSRHSKTPPVVPAGSSATSSFAPGNPSQDLRSSSAGAFGGFVGPSFGSVDPPQGSGNSSSGSGNPSRVDVGGFGGFGNSPFGTGFGRSSSGSGNPSVVASGGFGSLPLGSGNQSSGARNPSVVFGGSGNPSAGSGNRSSGEFGGVGSSLSHSGNLRGDLKEPSVVISGGFVSSSFGSTKQSSGSDKPFFGPGSGMFVAGGSSFGSARLSHKEPLTHTQSRKTKTLPSGKTIIVNLPSPQNYNFSSTGPSQLSEQSNVTIAATKPQRSRSVPRENAVSDLGIHVTDRQSRLLDAEHHEIGRRRALSTGARMPGGWIEDDDNTSSEDIIEPLAELSQLSQENDAGTRSTPSVSVTGPSGNEVVVRKPEIPTLVSGRGIVVQDDQMTPLLARADAATQTDENRDVQAPDLLPRLDNIRTRVRTACLRSLMLSSRAQYLAQRTNLADLKSTAPDVVSTEKTIFRFGVPTNS
ncbi:uncharacterized protein KY384_007986 [Bacidia gigantensis]|uniref:uncharacterized protein n=1 Tax=Bacidia gigantensis TaxID=2732470 RepID=UPI001D0430DD|nr:uncharacterized protein KY384_007986 [Bacidia gigantensis]KAG8527242.1 hypothetical protein KY384_007986 [Bacidia gigantensis]